MREIDRIVQLLDRSITGPAYHGPSVLDALKGVSASIAVCQPHGGGHSILELVSHLAAELRYARDLLGGTAAPWAEGQTTWPAIRESSATAWDRAREELGEATQALISAVEQLDDAMLAEELTHVRSTYYVMLHGIVQHNAYHAGQISLLRRQLHQADAGSGKQAVELFLDNLGDWIAPRSDIRAVALVGSYARRDPRPDSDVDLVMLCTAPANYLTDTSWVSEFGEVERVGIEDWGKVQSIRAFYRSGLEVEFGIAAKDWATIPPDPGTADVLKGGVEVLLDRDGTLSRLVQLVNGARPNRRCAEPPVPRHRVGLV